MKVWRAKIPAFGSVGKRNWKEHMTQWQIREVALPEGISHITPLCSQVHLLNDDSRGATVEAVISRMKTVQSTMTRNNTDSPNREGMRLIAISATIPNIEDVSREENNTLFFIFVLTPPRD